MFIVKQVHYAHRHKFTACRHISIVHSKQTVHVYMYCFETISIVYFTDDLSILCQFFKSKCK